MLIVSSLKFRKFIKYKELAVIKCDECYSRSVMVLKTQFIPSTQFREYFRKEGE